MTLTLQDRGIHDSDSPEKQGVGVKSHRTEGFMSSPALPAPCALRHLSGHMLGSAVGVGEWSWMTQRRSPPALASDAGVRS